MNLRTLKSFWTGEEKNNPDSLRYFHIVASIIILVIMAGLFVRFFWHLIGSRMDFYNELWGPAYLLVRWMSPYDTAILDPTLPAAWFPMAIGFFWPIGFLSEDVALQVWSFLNVIELGAIIYLVQGKSRTVYNTTIAALFSFCFPPTFYHFTLGQISITVTLSLVLASLFVIRDRHWIVAFFIALGLSKPQLGFLAVVGLSFYYLRQSGQEGMFRFWLRVFLMVMLLSIPLFIAYPNWIPDAITSMLSNPYWLYPSIFVLFQRLIGFWGYFAWGLIVIHILVLVYWLWRKFPPDLSMYWSLGLAPLASPYVGSWDFVVLLPILIAIFARVSWMQKLVLVLVYLFAWYGMALVQGLESSHNHFFWWVPIWFIATIALVTAWKKELHWGMTK